MSFEYVRKMPSAQEILAEMPLTDSLRIIKKQRDQDIIEVFKRESDKFLVIIGPCSADNEDAVCEYVSHLAKVQEMVKDSLILIPRIYTNKPRTTGQGYKGMMHQPIPTEDPNLVEGLKAIRRLHLRVLKETGLSAADEMLYPSNYPYLEDLLSYVAIGARSVENQQHRLTVSGLDVPVGMKNPTSGDFSVMLNSVFAAQKSHVFNYHDWEVKTNGNPYAHCVLRGAMDQAGNCLPNYHFEDLKKLADMYNPEKYQNPTIIVDTNHANSNKDCTQQPRIAKSVMHSIRQSNMLKQLIKGFMIESYLKEGSQSVEGKEYGKSITDPCLGWEVSKQLILELADLAARIKDG